MFEWVLNTPLTSKIYGQRFVNLCNDFVSGYFTPQEIKGSFSIYADHFILFRLKKGDKRGAKLSPLQTPHLPHSHPAIHSLLLLLDRTYNPLHLCPLSFLLFRNLKFVSQPSSSILVKICRQVDRILQ